MDQQVNRRKFLRNSVLSAGGLLLAGSNAKSLETQLFDLSDAYKLNLTPNRWTRVLQENHGARRFSSFRYVPQIDRFLLWGFHGFETDDYGNPDKPWTENKEYDMVAFNPREGRWENHFPKDKEAQWSKALPPMHQINSYQGITPGYYRPQLKERDGALRPDLNIVGDQVTYDAKRRRMVYFTGGRTFAYQVEDRQWFDIGGTTSPPPVLFGSLCYDQSRDRIVLSGGGYVAETREDGRVVGYTGVWIYDCESGRWSPANTTGQPPPRMCSRMTYDSQNDAMVVFGGDAQTHWLKDTWVLDLKTNSWRKSASKQGPPARAGHFTVYDPQTKMVIIGGGYNHTDLSDMWGYDARSDSWHRLTGQTPTGWHVSADIIQDKGIIVLTTSAKIAGDAEGCNETYPVRTTWTYLIKKQGLIDKSAKLATPQDIPKQVREIAKPDPARQNEQMKRIQQMPDNQWIHFNNPGRTAIVRAWGSCAFDTDKGRIIYWGGGHCGYGGNDYDYYDVQQHTWISGAQPGEFPDRSWDKGVAPGGVTFLGSPWTTHGRKIYAYDPVSKKVINAKPVGLAAGYEPEGLKDMEPRMQQFDDKNNFTRVSYSKWVTWACEEENNQNWEMVCGGLPGLDLLVQTPHGVMGIDHNWGAVDNKNRPDMTTWQGQPMVDNDVFLLSVADRKWKKLSLGGPWPQNLYEFTALVYDSKRNQLLLHGGGEKRDELWRFPLDKGLWEKLVPEFAEGAGTVPPECNREAVYLPKEDVFLTAARISGERGSASFWAYKVNENRWYMQSIQPPEGKTMNHMVSRSCAWSYDPLHNLVWMTLGGDMSPVEVYGLKFRFDT